MKQRSWTFLVLAFMVVTHVHSQEDRLGKLKFNGFVSIVGGRTIDDNATYVANAGSDLEGSTYDDSVSFAPDTTFGIQARAVLGEGLSATAQLLGHAADDFKVEFEWAYLQYDLTEEISIYAGRKRVPLFFHSDYLDVGYSYHWIRPPYEMYWVSMTSYDGVSARYATTFGPIESQVEIFYGGTETKESRATLAYGFEVDAELENISGIFWTVGYEWLQARVGMASARATITTTNHPLTPPGVLTTMSEGNDVDYYAATLMVDTQRFFVIGEYGETDFEKDINRAIGWYVSAGIHLGTFTPHATFSEFREKSNNTPSGEERSTTTVGVRYDFHPNAALKVEFLKVQDRGNVGNDIYGDAELISIGIDMTF